MIVRTTEPYYYSICLVKSINHVPLPCPPSGAAAEKWENNFSIKAFKFINKKLITMCIDKLARKSGLLREKL